MKLSTHFTLEELTKSQTAIRKRISNKPDLEERACLVLLCYNILEPVREHYKIPFTPNSGFRSKNLNKAVGGSKKSKHRSGLRKMNIFRVRKKKLKNKEDNREKD